ncbi:MAG: Gfo/Idh/MocA family oxidoreductase [Chlorobiaceae bacterium]|nr:Gfo/Idh/MocA family oxidoreductase [Chlorobiaceae bacterium]
MYSVINDRKIRIALAGCGRISKNHFAAINQHAESLELAAICDTDHHRLQEHQNHYNVPGYHRLESMLNAEKIDLIALCTPSGLHPAETMLAARYGVNVMTEKPMATRWHDGVNMVKACDEAGVRLFVVKQNRRNATLKLLKSAVEKERFGRIYMVNINVFWSRPQEYYDSATWRGTWEFDGGAFMNQASHYVDLIDWLIGPVESLQAYTATLARNIEVEDTGVVSFKWRSGALGSMNVTMLTYSKNFEGSITIIGEKGTVRVGGLAVNEIQHWEFKESDPDDDYLITASDETTSAYGYGHPLYYKNVIDVLQGKAEPEADGRENLHSLEILTAIYISSRDGKRVSLPLEY